MCACSRIMHFAQVCTNIYFHKWLQAVDCPLQVGLVVLTAFYNVLGESWHSVTCWTVTLCIRTLLTSLCLLLCTISYVVMLLARDCC